MKRFLLTILCGILSILLIATCYVAFRIWDAQDEFDKVFTLTPEQTILFVGDSHIGCSIVENEAYKNKVLWGNSESTRFTFLRLLELEKREMLNSVQLVVTELNYHSLYVEDSRVPNKFAALLPMTWKQIKYFSLSELLNGLENILLQEHIVANETVPSRKLSILTYNDTDRQKLCQQTADEHFLFDASRRAQSLMHRQKELQMILEVCKRNHLKFIVFSSPLSSFYSSLIPAYAKRDFQTLQDFLHKENIPYIDNREALQDDSFFIDSHHLSPVGREIFTTNLIQKINFLFMLSKKRDRGSQEHSH